MQLFLLILLFSGANTFLFSPDASSLFGRRPINCAWLPWTYAGCVEDHRGNLKIKETRGKIPAKNGGKPCTFGLLERVTNHECSKQQFVVSSVIKSIGAIMTHQKKTKPPSTTTTRPPPTSRNTTSTSEGANFLRRKRTIGPRLSPTPNPVCQARQFVDDVTGIKLFGKKCTRPQANRRMKRAEDPFEGAVRQIEHRDVLFLIDESGSVRSQNFLLEKKFVKALAKKFCGERVISGDRTRVALTTFTDGYTHHIDFDDYETLSGFRAAVDAVPYGGGGTCLVDALRAVRTEMFTSAKGSRVRNINTDGAREADGVIVLVTDGCFNCHPNENYAELLKEEQELLQDLGIFVIAFMINVDDDCVEQFTNLDNGSACFQGTRFGSWAAFHSLIADMEGTSLCIDAWNANEVQTGEQPCG